MSGTVLLIDYNPRSIGRIRGLLHGVGLRTFLARDGLSGIEIFERVRPDLTLIQDLVPKKPGEEVCRAIKRTAHGNRSAVLMIASGNNGHRRRALDAGCDDCIVKPFVDASFLEAIVKFLPQQAQATRPPAAPSPVVVPAASPPPPVPVVFEESELDACLDAVFGLGGTTTEAPPPKTPDPPAAKRKRSSAKPRAKAKTRVSKKSPRKKTRRKRSRKKKATGAGTKDA